MLASIILLFFGTGLSVLGGRILFTREGPKAMYKSGYWKEDTSKHGRRSDRIRGIGIFALGIILVVSGIAGLLVLLLNR